MGKKKKRRQPQKRRAERNGKKRLDMERATTLLGCSALPLIVAHPKVQILLEFTWSVNF